MLLADLTAAKFWSGGGSAHGKSITAMLIMHLLNRVVIAYMGASSLLGDDVLNAGKNSFVVAQHTSGDDLQEPMTALDPTRR